MGRSTAAGPLGVAPHGGAAGRACGAGQGFGCLSAVGGGGAFTPLYVLVKQLFDFDLIKAVAVALIVKCLPPERSPCAH